MATIHLGRLVGAGFSRVVAIKRLQAQLARDPEFVTMFLDEVRLAARIQHPNVIGTLDVVATDGELFLVMEYVKGDSLSRLLRAAAARGVRPPVPTLVAVLSGALHGLHAAHDARDESDRPLNIVHRDVSPQNILVGSDGMARIFDFGVAKAKGRYQSTAAGTLKGKIRYMAPEQFRDEAVTRGADIYAAGVVLFETLTGERMFSAEEPLAVKQIVEGRIRLPCAVAPWLPASFDEVVRRACASKPEDRFETAGEMAAALEACSPVASPAHVAAWVNETAADVLSKRAALVRQLEAGDVEGRPSLRDLLRASQPDHVEAALPPPEPPPPPQRSMPPAQPVTPPPPPEAEWKRAHVGFVAAAVAMAVVGVGLASVALHSRAASSAWPAASDDEGSRRATNQSAFPMAAVDATPDVAVEDVVLEDDVLVDAEPPRKLPTASATDPRARKPAPASSSKTANCTPPYTVDDRGRTVFKPECLE